MLSIRAQQFDALENDMRRRLKQRALSELRRQRSEAIAALGRATLSQWLDRAEQRIDEFAGVLTRDLTRYALLMVDFGPRFQVEQPWAVEIFQDPDIPGGSKLDVLEVEARDKPKSASSVPHQREEVQNG
jgi:hypothetical protein